MRSLMNKNPWVVVLASFAFIELLNADGNMWTDLILILFGLTPVIGVALLVYVSWKLVSMLSIVWRSFNDLIEEYSAPNLNHIWVQKHRRK